MAAAALVQCSPAPHPPAVSSSTTTATSAASEPMVRSVSAADLGASWRPGCPVPPEQLRSVELDYVGMDRLTHRGVLVVHEAVVADVIAIFGELRRQGYPIAKMQTTAHYRDADDELSMADNNTSAFNCRPLPRSTAWSWHAYGRAIDVNPLLNPYLDRTGALEPANAAPYLDRRRTDPGMLHAGDPAVRAFTGRGWTWGGDWQDPVDYQHFELPLS